MRRPEHGGLVEGADDEGGALGGDALGGVGEEDEGGELDGGTVGGVGDEDEGGELGGGTVGGTAEGMASVSWAMMRANRSSAWRTVPA